LEVDVQQGNFKILRLLPQVLILFLVEKWIPPSRSEIAKIGQKIEGILGVNYKTESNIWIHDQVWSKLTLKLDVQKNSIFFGYGEQRNIQEYFQIWNLSYWNLPKIIIIL
jgi:hypothetical protein